VGWVIVYDQVFGTQTMFEATTVFIENDQVKNDDGTISIFQQDFDDLESIEVKLEDEDKTYTSS